MNIGEITILFESPGWLLAIPFTLGLLALLLWRAPATIYELPRLELPTPKLIYRHPAVETIARLQQEQKPKNRFSLIFYFTVYATVSSLFIITLSHPYYLGKKLPDRHSERDIVFMVDTSINMELRDYVVNNKRVDRMTMVKNILSHFIDQMKDNRLSLLAFSEQPYLVVPLTRDHELLKYQLQRLAPAVHTGRISNPSKALLYVKKHFQQKNIQPPILVMLTGTNRPWRDIDPATAAEYLAQSGYRLHMVAIGASTYKADEKSLSALIYHPANFELLEKMATKGKGMFFPVQDSQSLNNALRTIEKSEKNEIEAPARYIKHSLYMWPLLSAILLLILLPLFRPGRKLE